MSSSSSRSRGWSLSQLWRHDEEMATKKNDDLGLPRHAKHSGQWQAAPRGAPRRRVVVRFAVYAAFLLLVVYGLHRAIHSSSEDTSLDSPHSSRRFPDAPPRYDPPPRMEENPPRLDTTGNEAKDGARDEPGPPKSYNGILKLPALGQSLRSIGETGGKSQSNRNVLFVAASLQSAAGLLPIACQMAAERENYVHFALMGRSDIPLRDLIEINGIDKSCPLFVHDARPDHASTSAEPRMALASARALYHINAYMHPQAVIVDASGAEDDYFLSAIRDQIRSLKSALIELPDKAGKRLSWLTKLDSSALAAWNTVHFDILVHAPPSGSGNLERLLKSLTRADLGGVTIPHMTIELPSAVEKHLEGFLADYHWPPASSGSVSQPQMLSLRHRIPRQRVNEEESSVRFLESFWPKQPSNSHVLVLSPHTEVTRQFFHYVKYSILHRRYSRTAMRQKWDDRLFGISYSAPTTHLDDITQFTPPKPLEEDKTESAGTSFLWQAPSSDAVLIMGERWVELHGYVSQFLEKRHSMSETPELLAKKEVGKTHPAWLEYALQLSRLRGYLTIYPSRQTASTILGVHADLYDVPEEYEGEVATGDKEGENVVSRAMEEFDSGSQVDMLITLPNEGELLPIHKLPWLAWDGKEADDEKIEADAAQYKREFRRQVGQCLEAEPKKPLAADPHATDLFCVTKETRA